MDLYHNTENVSKAIRLIGNRLNKFSIPIIKEGLINKRIKYLDQLDKLWFVDRLKYASFDILDTDYNNAIINADRITSGKIEILGVEVDVSKDIQWNKDFKSNYVWENGKHYLKYRTVVNDNNSDVKSVWELSRGHYLLWLAEAYKATKLDGYAEQVITIIESWIDNNPFERNINWTCSMEVAIRAVNWIFALSIISVSDAVSVHSLRKIFKSLYFHGYHIYINLEDDFPYSANHYLSDISGLIFIGYLFESDANGIKWLEYSLKSFLYEVRTQILPSGVHFEKSISYHRLVTEIFLYSLQIIKKNSPNYISVDITERINSLASFIVSYTKPNGKAPLIADNDNGRYLPFVKRDYRDHIYLIDLFLKYGQIESTPIKRTLFADAGMCFINNDLYYVNFINTGISKYYRPYKKQCTIGTHTHLDHLSFELTKKRKDFIIDPGSYIYTSDKNLRNEFRSGLKHNTLTVDNCSPYTLDQYFFFNIDKNRQYIEPSAIIINTKDEMTVASSEYYWCKFNVRHCRTISVSNNYVRIEDKIIADSNHQYTFSFHLDPEVEAIIISEEKNRIILRNGDEELILQIKSSSEFKIGIINDTVSPSYGILLPSKTIRVEVNAYENFSIEFVMN